MRKIQTLFAAMLGAIALTGCSIVQTAANADFHGQQIAAPNAGAQIGHVTAMTGGLYLFSIPLITGSAVEPGFPVLLEDTVNSVVLSRMVTAKAKAMGGKKVADLTTSGDSTGFIIYWRTSYASATVTK